MTIKNNNDLRSIKTNRALMSALRDLLENQTFLSINTSDICKLALVSRSAFYDHYKGKYGLLEQWLNELVDLQFANNEDFNDFHIPDILSDLIRTHSSVILNLTKESDFLLDDIVFNFISKIVQIIFPSVITTVLTSFISAGILNVISRLLRDDREDEGLINETIHCLLAVTQKLVYMDLDFQLDKQV